MDTPLACFVPLGSLFCSWLRFAVKAFDCYSLPARLVVLHLLSRDCRKSQQSHNLACKIVLTL